MTEKSENIENNFTKIFLELNKNLYDNIEDINIVNDIIIDTKKRLLKKYLKKNWNKAIQILNNYKYIIIWLKNL